jgi:hypothetical protein
VAASNSNPSLAKVPPCDSCRTAAYDLATAYWGVAR